FDFILLPLLEVNDGRAFADIVSTVFTGQRIDRIRSKLATSRGLGDSFANSGTDCDLIHADRCVDVESRHAGILANRTFVIQSHIDVAEDDAQGLRGLCTWRFVQPGGGHDCAHVWWEVSRGLRNQLDEAVFQELHGNLYLSWACTVHVMPGR